MISKSNLDTLLLPKNEELKNVIEENNLGTVLYMRKNFETQRHPDTTGDYTLILTNRHQNYLLIPTRFFGLEGEIYSGEILYNNPLKLIVSILAFYDTTNKSIGMKPRTYIQEL